MSYKTNFLKILKPITMWIALSVLTYFFAAIGLLTVIFIAAVSAKNYGKGKK